MLHNLGFYGDCVPDRIKKALEVVECAFPNVRLAGGAARDAVLGRTPRDFDIFVEGDASTTECMAKALGSAARMTYRVYMPERAVFSIGDIQLIGCENPHLAIINEFATSLSQAWFDEKFNVWCTREFLRSVCERSVLIYDRPWSNELYISKMKKTFSDFAFTKAVYP